MNRYLQVFNTKSTSQSIVSYVILLVLLALMLIILFNIPLHRWGDSSTYYMQISSISEDFDIEY